MRKNRILAAICAWLLLFAAAVPGFAASDLIETREDFLAALRSAKDGDTLYVGDIDFSPPFGTVHSVLRIEIDKSVTIASGKAENAVLTDACFQLFGGKEGITCTFRDVVFDGNVDAKTVYAEDWDPPHDPIEGDPNSDEPARGNFVAAFRGNVEVTFENCVFRNYLYEKGPVFRAFYGDYSKEPEMLAMHGDQTGSVLNITAENCVFSGNSALYDGSAVYLEGSGNVAFHAYNCTFENNITSGEGVIVTAGEVTVETVNCTERENQGGYVYENAPEEAPQDSGQTAWQKPAIAGLAAGVMISAVIGLYRRKKSLG